ncbi:hypothetical protein FOXB_15061 [Fusarium oxysporum f. sp. conglutinans Fo5176]|uniref:Uncharacterized protein n=1 Tax=Fusarium oxysporum (strain Fo5176) TaxID=660025 RepID=F9G8S9_FUSOF|nr:hypothetical protein FOXB_15061 [Fusarium oxysporum f. sp. conglutinans Fo5176]
MPSHIALPGAARPRPRFRVNGSNWRWVKKGSTLLFALFASALTIYYLIHNDSVWRPTGPILQETLVTPANISSGERKFVIVLPVDDSSPDLCKVVSSAVALGYPAPVIVNWKKDFHTEADGIGPSQLGKITGTLNYLQWATGDVVSEEEKLGEDDLVLMLDAHDIWLQLPPSVMMHRYYSSNERANRRIAEEYGFFDKELMQQTIIAAAQKGCIAPRDKISNLYCNDVPDSTLPENVFGFFTDYTVSRYKYMRPKYVNSGSFMGPAGDMRRYFQRVKDRMDQDLLEVRSAEDLAGDQGIFAEVFGEQELWRRQIKQDDFAGDNPGKEAAVSARDEFEYHVGLDYTQELFYPTCYSDYGGAFVSLDDPSSIAKESSQAGVSPPRVGGVPSDISKAEVPFSQLDDHEGGWGDVSLFVDFWTTSVPVAIHHNAWRDGLKARRSTWWDKTWYFPQLRNLLEAHMTANTTTPLASITADDGNLEVWSYGAKTKGSASLLFGKNKDTKAWELRSTDWDTICKASNEVETESRWYDETIVCRQLCLRDLCDLRLLTIEIRDTLAEMAKNLRYNLNVCQNFLADVSAQGMSALGRDRLYLHASRPGRRVFLAAGLGDGLRRRDLRGAV